MKLKSSFLGICLLFNFSGCSSTSKEYNTPFRKACEHNGGNYSHIKKMVGLNPYTQKYRYVQSCNALTVNEAKKSCSEMGMKLPTLNALLMVAKECGSENTVFKKRIGWEDARGTYHTDKDGTPFLAWKNTKSEKLYSQCYYAKGFKPDIAYLTSTTTSDGNTISFSFTKRSTNSLWTFSKTSLLPYKSWGSVHVLKGIVPSTALVKCKANKHN